MRVSVLQPPSESSCSAVTLIHAAYANLHPLERFSKNMTLFILPIIVYIIIAARPGTLLINDTRMKRRGTFSHTNKLCCPRGLQRWAPPNWLLFLKHIRNHVLVIYSGFSFLWVTLIDVWILGAGAAGLLQSDRLTCTRGFHVWHVRRSVVWAAPQLTVLFYDRTHVFSTGRGSPQCPRPPPAPMSPWWANDRCFLNQRQTRTVIKTHIKVVFCSLE